MPAAAAMALQDAPSEQTAMRSAAFASLGLTEQLLHALSEQNLEEPTEVQVRPYFKVLYGTQPDTSQASAVQWTSSCWLRLLQVICASSHHVEPQSQSLAPFHTELDGLWILAVLLTMSLDAGQSNSCHPEQTGRSHSLSHGLRQDAGLPAAAGERLLWAPSQLHKRSCFLI